MAKQNPAPHTIRDQEFVYDRNKNQFVATAVCSCGRYFVAQSANDKKAKRKLNKQKYRHWAMVGITRR